jgi:hypothetical protein
MLWGVLWWYNNHTKFCENQTTDSKTEGGDTCTNTQHTAWWSHKGYFFFLLRRESS